MAKGIKGIVIEIGADTKPLEKALDGVNKKSKDIQSELKQVDRLLKLDPKNTALVEQKQKLLAEAINNTKDKLDALKDAEKQVQKQFEKGEIGEDQYRAIQRELISTEQNLKSLEKQLGDVNNKWKSAADGIGEFGAKTEATGKKMLPVTGAIVGAGIAATVMSTQFDDAMAKVSTIADTTEVPFDNLRKQIIDMSNETGIAAGDIANNVYDAISAGQKTGDAVAFVGDSAKLSKAGFADSAAALDILTTTLNAYGLESSEATKVSDILIQTQNKGKVTVGELAASMGKIIPTAKAANVNLEQLGAGYAVMTSKGIKAAETTTYMNSMLNELTKSGSKSSDSLKESTGKTFEELSAEGKSLSDILVILDNSAKESGLGLKDMFGSAEAGKAALTLVTDEGKAFNNALMDMQNSTGATSEAFEKLQTPGEKARKSINKLKNEAMGFGDILAPVFEKLADLLASLGEFIDGLSDEQKKTIITILAIVAAIGPLLIVVGKMATGISAIMTLSATLAPVLGVVTAAFGAITAPMIAVVAAIAAIIAIGVTLYKNWDTIKEKADSLKEKIKNLFDFKWKLPEIKLPHFSMQGEFSLSPPSIPKIGVDWYKTGSVFTKPNIIGVGEGGEPEGVFPLSKLKDFIGQGQGSSTVNHTGTIRVEGVNNRGELVAVVEQQITNNITSDNRRIPNRTSLIPIG